ncbi:MAG: hypothetical protein NUV91_05105, partial [Candidatus Omnitrophica bacterium]|nr:hypothetical protein [Candidatus Omnitrophota bacterium]
FYFLQYVDKEIARRRMRGRVMFLRRIKRDVEKLATDVPSKSPHLNIILEHDLDLVEAEIKSLTRLIETL